MKDKKDMLYYARNDLGFLKMVPEDNLLEHKDKILIELQQCIEKFLKYILKEKLGEINETHNIPLIYKKILPKYPQLKGYDKTLIELRSCFYDRRYENENYFEYSDEDFKEIYDHSMELINKIEKLISEWDTKIKGF